MSNVVTIAETKGAKGRQPGQRVESLDLRAYRALIGFDFNAYEDKDALVTAVIERLRTRDVF